MANIKFKRGNKANMPSSAPDGMPLWCSDTKELYIGTGNSVFQITGGSGITESEVNTKLSNYVQKTQLATKNSTGLVKIGNELNIKNDGTISGIPVLGTNGISINQRLATSLSVLSSNSNLVFENNYSGVKGSEGIVTETLTCKKGYKAYFIKDGTPYEFSSMGLSDEIDPSKFIGNTANECTSSGHIIVNNQLYYSNPNSSPFTLNKISTLTGWTLLMGSYGVCNGKLYSLSSTEATLISSLTGWTCLCSGYGICNGNLYQLSTSATLLDSTRNWTKISGYYRAADTSGTYKYYAAYPYGIADGKLFQINNTTITQVGTDTTWTDITGYSYYYSYGSGSTGNHYAYGINAGRLYSLKTTTAATVTVTQVGTDSTWTKILGRDETYTDGTSVGDYALGLNKGKIYYINGGSASTISSYSDWEYLTGYIYTNSGYQLKSGFAIRNNSLYWINRSNYTHQATLISGIGVPKKVFATYYGAFVVCEPEWQKNNADILLSDYGLSIASGIPKVNDTLTLTFTTGQTNVFANNTPYIIDMYDSGISGYILYSNKYCIQWGMTARTAASTTISLFKAYRDKNYNILISPFHTALNTDGRPPLVNSEIEVDSFILNMYTAYAGVYWTTKGYLTA